jgi:hypothetical protein
MATCNPETLLANAACLQCGVAPGALPYVEAQLLIDIMKITDPTGDYSVDAIIARSSCLQCKLTPQAANYVIAQLLCELLSAVQTP